MHNSLSHGMVQKTLSDSSAGGNALFVSEQREEFPTSLRWHEGYGKLNNHPLQPWWAEKACQKSYHVKPWGKWAITAEDNIWGYSGHRIIKTR